MHSLEGAARANNVTGKEKGKSYHMTMQQAQRPFFSFKSSGGSCTLTGCVMGFGDVIGVAWAVGVCMVGIVL